MAAISPRVLTVTNAAEHRKKMRDKSVKYEQKTIVVNAKRRQNQRYTVANVEL